MGAADAATDAWLDCRQQRRRSDSRITRRVAASTGTWRTTYRWAWAAGHAAAGAPLGPGWPNGDLSIPPLPGPTPRPLRRCQSATCGQGPVTRRARFYHHAPLPTGPGTPALAGPYGPRTANRIRPARRCAQPNGPGQSRRIRPVRLRRRAAGRSRRGGPGSARLAARAPPTRRGLPRHRHRGRGCLTSGCPGACGYF